MYMSLHIAVGGASAYYNIASVAQSLSTTPAEVVMLIKLTSTQPRIDSKYSRMLQVFPVALYHARYCAICLPTIGTTFLNLSPGLKYPAWDNP